MPGDSSNPSKDPMTIEIAKPCPATAETINQAITAIPAKSRMDWSRFRNWWRGVAVMIAIDFTRG
ncbi:hypothetical protein KU6B_21500 [Mameliella alba]|nr:hypothetical protein KU6B_21500 [Mameliella alba]